MKYLCLVRLVAEDARTLEVLGLPGAGAAARAGKAGEKRR